VRQPCPSPYTAQAGARSRTLRGNARGVMHATADGLTYRSHHDRAAALPLWLNHYDTAPPHSSLAGAPPAAAFTRS